uniref:Uncharacterized protein n=1 Tax=Candidatus Kentrum sp. FW TaxID=2126338 RepID=A0A450SWS2_9GAMM|nr:MAG: hypothetical protein BECKFW1821A_GA0114235_108213 [Candidatus Kentron sp. FW]VFJ63096.1 MAG: hypothetical protein BECKFW1821B_GA0114236_107914 [Candidatus Kentron sp. FW]
MNNSEKRSLGEEFKNWVQTLAIILAGLWGAYVFIYQEFWIPKSAPTSLTLDVSLRKAGKTNYDNKHSQAAIELSIIAKNTTKYPIGLLPGIFMIHGIEFTVAGSDEDTFDKKLESELVIPYSGKYRNRHFMEKSRTEVSIGSPFSDTVLKPGETIKRVFLTTIPADKYDALKASIIIPRCREGTSLESCEEKKERFEWDYNKEKYFPELFFLNGEERKLIEKDHYESYRIRMAISEVMLSLWE